VTRKAGERERERDRYSEGRNEAVTHEAGTSIGSKQREAPIAAEGAAAV